MSRVLLAVILHAATAGRQVDSGQGRTNVQMVVESARDRTTYRYTVHNSGDSSISAVFIGIAEGTDEPELTTPAIGWRRGAACSGSTTVPPGWTGCVGSQEESAKFFMEFSTEREASELAPGASMTVAVAVARPDPTYERAVFWAIRSSGAADIGRVAGPAKR